jgi:hypothetical protein
MCIDRVSKVGWNKTAQCLSVWRQKQRKKVKHVYIFLTLGIRIDHKVGFKNRSLDRTLTSDDNQTMFLMIGAPLTGTYVAYYKLEGLAIVSLSSHYKSNTIYMCLSPATCYQSGLLCPDMLTMPTWLTYHDFPLLSKIINSWPS